MGRTLKLKYRVEYTDNLLAMGKATADARPADINKRVYVQGYKGLPTVEALEDWRMTMNRSFQAGGSNAHISKAFNTVAHINWARVVRQADGKVMAETTMPTFEIVETTNGVPGRPKFPLT